MKTGKFFRIFAVFCAFALLSGCGSSPVPVSAEPSATVAPTFTPLPTATPLPSPTPTAEPTPDLSLRIPRVPILMYHQVAAPEENDLYLSPADFQSQLDWLYDHGYSPVTMRRLWENWALGEPLPAKCVVLTFDDGYLPMYTEVFPRLRERGWSATFYMISNAVNDPTSFLSVDMLKEMADGGMEIGSHTYHHYEVDGLDADTLNFELTASKRALEEYTGHEVTAFCYPSGHYDDAAIAAVADAGYITAVTTEYGTADIDQGFYLLSRLRISAGMDGAALGNMLTAQGFTD